MSSFFAAVWINRTIIIFLYSGWDQKWSSTPFRQLHSHLSAVDVPWHDDALSEKLICYREFCADIGFFPPDRRDAFHSHHYQIRLSLQRAANVAWHVGIRINTYCLCWFWEWLATRIMPCHPQIFPVGSKVTAYMKLLDDYQIFSYSLPLSLQFPLSLLDVRVINHSLSRSWHSWRSFLVLITLEILGCADGVLNRD